MIDRAIAAQKFKEAGEMAEELNDIALENGWTLGETVTVGAAMILKAVNEIVERQQQESTSPSTMDDEKVKLVGQFIGNLFKDEGMEGIQTLLVSLLALLITLDHEIQKRCDEDDKFDATLN